MPESRIASQPTINAALFNSLVTCPHCGHAKVETMPADACLFFYKCEAAR